MFSLRRSFCFSIPQHVLYQIRLDRLGFGTPWRTETVALARQLDCEPHYDRVQRIIGVILYTWELKGTAHDTVDPLEITWENRLEAKHKRNGIGGFLTTRVAELFTLDGEPHAVGVKDMYPHELWVVVFELARKDVWRHQAD